MRYNPDLTAEGLRVLGLGNVRPGNVQVMDPFEFMRQIGHFGKAHAGNVSLDHFKTFV